MSRADEIIQSIADKWEDCGSLACTLLDIKLERVTFGPEGMTMDCETAKTLANAVIARLRTEAECLKSGSSAEPEGKVGPA
jgi:hypothetical protein